MPGTKPRPTPGGAVCSAAVCRQRSCARRPLYSLNQFNEITAIIAQGDSSLSEDEDRGLLAKACDSRDVTGSWPSRSLSTGQRTCGCFAVLLLEEPHPTLGPLLADLFLQWHAVAEFMSVQKAELIDENFPTARRN